MKEWLKKYSIQATIATTLAGLVMSVLPYFNMYIPQEAMGAIMAVCGIVTGIGRVLPQLTGEGE